MVAAPTFLI